jgi:hypothetical protein
MPKLITHNNLCFFVHDMPVQLRQVFGEFIKTHGRLGSEIADYIDSISTVLKDRQQFEEDMQIKLAAFQSFFELARRQIQWYKAEERKNKREEQKNPRHKAFDADNPWQALNPLFLEALRWKGVMDPGRHLHERDTAVERPRITRPYSKGRVVEDMRNNVVSLEYVHESELEYA